MFVASNWLKSRQNIAGLDYSIAGHLEAAERGNSHAPGG